MQTGTDTQEIVLDGWVFRVRPGQPGRPRLLVQVHGWTGDESVMWIFTRRVPPDTWILSPRAPFPAPQSGFSWLESHRGLESELSEYQATVGELLQRIDAWSSPPELDKQHFSMVGFSQGAALTYAAALYHSDRISRLAGLAGFLPAGAEEAVPAGEQLFQGKPVYIAHGSQDKRVPVDRAQAAARFFKEKGADVTYCESDVGHKLSLDCLKGLEQFLS